MFPWSIYSVKLTFVSVNEFRCTGLRTKYLSCVFSKNTESTFSTSHGRHQVRGWCPDLWMVPKCHAVPCNVQEDLGSTLLDGYQSGECEYRHFLAFHYTTYVISVLTVSEPKGFKLDARQQRELGGHPGFLQLRTRAGTTREISTATSRALRLQSHVRARASASGKESAKKKKKPKSLGRLSRPESAAAELGGGRPSAESRAPGGGHVRPPATRSRPAVTVPSPPIPTKAVSPAAALTRAAPDPTPPRRPAALTSCPGRSSPRHWLGNSWSTSWTPAAQPPAATSPTGAAGPRAGAARAPPDPPSAVGSGETRVRRRRPPGPRACRRREETTPETPPLGPRLCPEEASPRSWAGAEKTARPGGHRRVAGAAECPVDLKDPGAVHFRFRGGARAAEAEVTRRGSEAWALALPRVHRGER